MSFISLLIILFFMLISFYVLASLAYLILSVLSTIDSQGAEGIPIETASRLRPIVIFCSSNQVKIAEYRRAFGDRLLTAQLANDSEVQAMPNDWRSVIVAKAAMAYEALLLAGKPVDGYIIVEDTSLGFLRFSGWPGINIKNVADNEYAVVTAVSEENSALQHHVAVAVVNLTTGMAAVRRVTHAGTWHPHEGRTGYGYDPHVRLHVDDCYMSDADCNVTRRCAAEWAHDVVDDPMSIKQGVEWHMLPSNKPYLLVVDRHGTNVTRRCINKHGDVCANRGKLQYVFGKCKRCARRNKITSFMGVVLCIISGVWLARSDTGICTWHTLLEQRNTLLFVTVVALTAVIAQCIAVNRDISRIACRMRERRVHMNNNFRNV